MTRIRFAFMAAMLLALAVTVVQAEPNEHGNGYRVASFIDEDGDGFNDLAPDADGDGIPNGLDSNYVRPQDGSGAGFGRSAGRQVSLADWSQLMADKAFNYYYYFGFFGPQALETPRGGYGPGDCSGFGGEGPADGTGFGPGSGTGNGTGDCDDTGPNGQQGGPPDRNGRR